MKIAAYLAHPSQYYVFRRTVRELRKKGHCVHLFIKSKDILEELLRADDQECVNLSPNVRSGRLGGLVWSVVTRNYLFLKQLKKLQIELLISAASDCSQAAVMRGIPSIILNDDDAPVIRKSAHFGWPFSSVILAPRSCNMGYWRRKSIFYDGYQKLFYLHPKSFQADKAIAEQYFSIEKPFFLIRSVSLTAHHDKNIRGLNNEIVEKLIGRLSPYGQVFISSERFLANSLEKYRLKINPLDMHHLLYYAKLLIGDSQSMAHEAAVLGVPSVRFNDFVGRIGVLDELERKYGLTFGIRPDHPEELLQKAGELAALEDEDWFREKAKVMLDDMIDPTAMLVWFIENYPESARVLKEDPDYQYRFR